jgi:phosphoglycolate phosphatase
MRPAMRLFDLALFDLDGTLVDSKDDIAAALGAALVELGLPSLPPERVVGMIGGGVSALAERALPPERRGERDHLVTVFRRHYGAHLLDRTRFYDGVPELLSRARDEGLRCAVATNKPAAFARSIVEGLGAASWFIATVGEGEGVPPKPDPTCVQRIRAASDAPLPRALFVGDSPIDLATARAARIPAALVTWGYTSREALRAAGPEHLVDDVRALERVLFGVGA